MQAQLICLIFNLIQIIKSARREKGVCNVAEEERHARRAAPTKA